MKHKMDQSHLVGTLLFGWLARSELRGELNARFPKKFGSEPLMDLIYKGYHLDNFCIAHLHARKKEIKT